MNKESKIKALLDKRVTQNAFRELTIQDSSKIDFSSNDYLGLARSVDLKEKIQKAYNSLFYKNGATGSRLLTGNNELTISCEEKLAHLFGFESTLIFNSGYMANLAFFSSVPQRGDTIIYDEYVHACIKDGSRLSLAKRLPFKHNDLDDLRKKLEIADGEVYIVCESVYSMDGDVAPLREITSISKDFGAKTVVDEAHSTGIWGKYGSGMVSDLGLQNDVYAVIYTFGKAMGIHGACIAGSLTLKQFITNFSRPFIYTTAPSPYEVLCIQCAFEYLQTHPSLPLNLMAKIKYFNKLMPQLSSPSAIKSLVIGGNEKTRSLAKDLQDQGFDIRPILSPTVKEGTERLRICLHTYNTEEEIALIYQLLKTAKA